MSGATPRDPLDPVERALADALGQTTPVPGPSPALDASILAAAHAAAAEHAAAAGGAPAGGPPHAPPAASGQRRRRRSPVWLRGGALAATLVIAVGVAWQLRPRFEAPGLVVEAPVAAPGATAATRAAAPAAAPPAEASSPARARGSDSAAPPSEPPAALRAQRAAIAPTAASTFDAPEREAPPVVFDEPSPMDVPAPAPKPAMPAPSPPAPPAPPAPSMPRQEAAAAHAREPRADALKRRTAPPAVATQDAAADEAGMHEDWLDQPLDDTPPASVDSPAVREAWLARIRELVSAERYAEARDSYAEFRSRHPDAPVPADLRMLLGEE